MKSFLVWLLLSLSACLCLDVPLRAQPSPRVPDRQKVLASALQVPLAFEANRGQTDPQVKFLSRGSGYTLFLTPGEAVLSLRRPSPPAPLPHEKCEVRSTKGEVSAFGRTSTFELRTSVEGWQAQPDGVRADVLHLRLLGANQDPRVTGADPQPGVSNYFLGNDPRKWRTNVPHVGKVRYEGVYPGIDLVHYGNQRRLEHDFIVSPGADPGQIRFRVDGADSLGLNADGDLILYTPGGEVILQAPVAYQEVGGGRRHVLSHYVIAGEGWPSPPDPLSQKQERGRGSPLPFLGEGWRASRAGVRAVSFALGPYDPSHPLIIDPILSYSTYLGGSGTDIANGIAVDGSGNAYIVGQTTSTNFPATSYQNVNAGGTDVFAAKLNASGSALTYSTYLGGSGTDAGTGIAVDASGNAYITGYTASADFPKVSALDASLGGTQDAFVAKLNASGSALIYSTYLGGSGTDAGAGIAVDASGNAYVAGNTTSADFLTVNPYDASLGGTQDAFVAKLNPGGSSLIYSTYLGGNTGVDEATGIAVDASGDAFVVGYTQSADFPTVSAFQGAHGGGTNDAFVTRFNSVGSALTYSTFLGGSGSDTGYGIAVDGGSNACVVGQTSSGNFPTAGAYQGASGGGTDAFVTRLISTGLGAVYSTYLGGSGTDIAYGVAVDNSSNVYVTGKTGSSNFPTTSAIQSTKGAGDDAFVTKFNSAGSALYYSTYLGGNGTDVGRDIDVYAGTENAFVVGEVGSTDLTTLSYQNANAGGTDAFVAKITPKPAITSISPTSGNVGASVTITGSGFSPTAASNTVFFGATKATVTAASATSLTATVPTGATFGPVSVAAGGETALSTQFFLPTFTGTGSTIDASNLAAKVDFATGTSPYSVAMGDVDGDGKPDIVVVNNLSNTVSVFRNTSTSGAINSSSFATKVDFATGTSPRHVAMGDVDGDGKPDLVVANNGSNTVSVFRNTSTSGTISFAAKVDFTTGTSPTGVAIGDVDGDGKPDIVVANNGSATASVLRNTSVSGAISFAAKVDFTTGTNPINVAIGDVDGDGKPDLVVANNFSASVSVFRNTSSSGTINSSSFATKVDFTTGSGPVSVTIVDVDGDGKLDIVVANTSSNTASVLRNTSTSGTINSSSFAAKVDFATGTGPIGVATGDVDGDGKSDLAVTNYNSNTVSVYRNTSSSGAIDASSFAAKVDFPTGTAPRGMAVGDVDGDGKPDLVIVNYNPNTMSVLHNLTTTTPLSTITSISPTSAAPGASVTITGTNFSTTAANNTVFFDPVKATVTSASSTSLTVTVPNGAGYGPISVTVNGRTAISKQFFLPTFTGAGPGIGANSLVSKVDFATGTGPYGVAAGDVDGDGKPDLAVVNNGSASVSVLRNTSTSGVINTSSFAAKVDFTTGSGPYSVAMGDLDGDGKPDLIVTNYGGGSGTTVSVLRNTSSSGAVSFASKEDFTTGTVPIGVAMGDLDGDGKPDIAVANNGSATVSVFRNTSTSGAISASSFASKVDFTTGTGPFGVAMGDVDGDGKPDLVVTNYGSGSGTTVSVLRNTSSSGAINSSSFATKVDFTTGTGPQSVTMGDVDGDGKPDLAVVNNGSSAVSVLRNTSSSGTVSFASKVDFTTGTAPAGVAMGDLDGDGKPDLAVTNYGAGSGTTASVLRNTSSSGTVSFASKVDFTTGTAPLRVEIGDLDGDGKPDIAVANASSNTVSVLRNLDPLFLEVGASAGVADAGTGEGAAWGDYDGDGDQDLYVVNYGSANRLYRNDGNGVFTEVGASAGVADPGNGNGAAWGDYDNDGDLDLYLTNNGTNRLYRNNGNGTFTEVGPTAGVANVGYGIGTAWGDYDNDGDLDLYVVGYGSANLLYRNNGNGLFTEVGVSAGVANVANGYAAAWGDYDNDGDLDLYVANNGANRLYRNNGNGTFADVGAAAGVDDGGVGTGTAWGDYDNDGDLDLYVANYGTANRLYRNNGNGTFAEVGATAGVADAGSGFGAAWGDYDGDGDLDLYLVNQGTNRLYRNKGNSNRWLHVKLVGTSSNRDGIGAVVTARTNPLQRRDVDGGSGAYSQPSLPVEFGFGATTTVDTLTVRWPSGAVSTLTGVATNQTLTVTEPKIQLSTTSLAFGNVEKGASSNLTFTVTNTGGGTLSVGSVTSSNARFTVSPSGVNLSANANQLFTVTFSPITVGSQAGTITVSHNGAGNPSSVSLSGTGGDTTPPAAPAGLTATAGNNQVALSWTANTESDLSYYVVYRSTVNNFTPTSAEDIAHVTKPAGALDVAYVAGTSYTNTGLSAGTYYFKIKAVDSSGNASAASAQASATLAPGYSQSSSSLSFGSVNVGGTPGTQTFTVSNTGTAALSVGSITVSGADASQFTVNPASFTVNAGAAAQTVTATFTPTGGPGSRSASLSVAHNAAGSPASLSVAGTALAPTISLPQTSLAFGDVAVGKTAALNVSAQNTGTATLSISGVTVTGADAAQFAVTVTASSVAPGQTAVVAVVAFAPTSSGAKSATLSVAHNAVGSPSTVSLSGSALPGRISVLTTALSFGELEAGKNKVLFLTISNVGAGPLSVGSITSTSPRFTVSETAFTISPGSSKEVSITFAPAAEEALTATLTINSNDPDRPGVQVSLSGSGFVIRPRIGVSPDRLDFGDLFIGQQKTLTLTISNGGRAALKVSEVKVENARFSISSAALIDEVSVGRRELSVPLQAGGVGPFEVPPNGRKDLSVTFKPTNTDPVSASLTIRSNDPDAGERPVPVTGRGQTPPPEVDVRATDAAGQPLMTGRAPLTVKFTVVNTGGPVTGYEWTFGDGSQPGSTQETAVTYTYSAPGTYTVTLKATGPGGTATKTKERLIVVKPTVEADFGAGPASGKAPLAVAFTDSSQGQVTSWSWDFGDGETSTEQSPKHTYKAPGVYAVKLTVKGAGGASDTKTKENLISIPPVADFAASPVSGLDSLVVAFADSSKGAASWQWAFGDGETSTEQNPKHAYKKPGVYTVKLTVKGPGGQDVRERQGFIQIRQRVRADFTASPASGRAPLTVKFTDASKGEIASREWAFGDGETSTEQNPSHIYTREAEFTVTLKVTGPAGSDAKTVSIAVVPNKPPARPVPLSPAEDAAGVSLSPTLTWEGSADPEGDPVVYDVFLGESRVRSTSETRLTVGPLSEGTDYTWRVVAGDDRGGRAEGPTRRFRTAGDTQAPAVLSGPVAEGITRTGATLRWTTDEASRPAVEYRVQGTPAFTASAQGPPGKEQGVALAGLLPGTTYEYRVLSRDAAGNVSTFPNPPYPTFTTLAAADVTPPQFTVPASAPFVSDSSAVIVWTTDERGSSEVSFRLESEVGFTNAPPGEAGIDHRVVLVGLRPGSAYIVRVRSVDASGNASSSELRVVTLPRSAAPARLRIFNVSVVGRTESQAVVEWSTDRPASGLVRFGLTSLLNPSQAQSGEDGVLEHRVTLTRLNPDTEYFYRVLSAASPADSSDVFSFRTRAAARATPPVILQGPVAQGIGQDRATVRWKTDEVSNSVVEFDTVAALATRAVTVPEQVVDHAVTLTGLTPGKTYYYRVRSTGLTRLSAVSEVLSFTTLIARDATPPVILEGPTVTARTPSGFTVEWVTDEISTSEVVYGPPDSLTLSRSAPGLVQRHSVRVGDLRPATRYAFRVRSADAAGNVRESDVLNVTTLAEELVDRTSPRLVSPPSAAGVTHREATVGWETDEPANSLVEFGKTEKGLSEVQGEARAYATGHSVRLTDLSAATTYYYRVSSTDAAGNGPTKGAVQAFTTRAAPDLAPARITSGPTVVSTRDRTAILEWTTDELSDTQVDYAAGENVDGSRLTQRVVSPEAVIVHRVTLTNLTPGTTYSFRAGSQDIARNARTFSDVGRFGTLAAPDETQPDLVNAPASAEVTASTATLLWTTDEPTNAIVEYGTGDYGGGRVERGAPEKSHTVTLTGLTPDMEYRWRVTSRDREGNGVSTDPTVTIPPARTRLRSSDLRFRTTRAADTMPPVIVEGPITQISGGNVVVRWVTDELSNSRVVYATRANYNRPGLESDVFDARLVTVHLVTLAGLDLSTQYLFRCVSADAAGNTVASGGSRSTKPVEGGGLALQPPGGDGSFTTAPQADRQAPVILSGPTVSGSTSSSLTLEWQTDEASDSFVEYGSGERAVSRAEEGTPVTRHRIVLTKLTPRTAYTFTVGSADPSRNGPTRSKPAVGSTAAEVDVSPPRILGSPAISYKSDRQAVVAWRTDEASSSTVEYRTESGSLLTRSVPDPVVEHRVTLTNLTGATAYTFRAGSIDASNNGPAWSQELRFTTDPTPDTTPPRILGDPKISAVTEGGATVEWSTDELSDSAVRFGTAAGALDFNVGSSEAVTAHKVALTNLKPATAYFLRVSSIDRSGNGPALSPEGGRTVSFTTASGRDTIPPGQIRAVLGLAGSRVVALSWPSSPEPDIAGYNVYRGTGGETPRLAASNLTLARFVDEGLTDETTYRYAVTALDRAGNEGPRSDVASFTPSARNAPTAPVFRGAQGKPLAPTFVVENATSPRNNPLTYAFQVSARQDFADVAASAVGVKEGNESAEKGLTAWTIPRELTEGGTYYLRVRANDGAFDGPFMTALSFRAGVLEQPGDFNGDLAVDFEDFFLFAGAFGSRATGENARFDMVRNGEIDFEDFFAFAGLFGKRYAR